MRDASPEERGEMLLEIAHQHALGGEHDQAVAIWRELVAEGGEDGDCARASLAEWLFDTGAEDAARLELDTLKATRRVDSLGWSAAAELFEERGELAEAHLWLTMMTTRLTEGDLAAMRGEFGWSTYTGMIVRSRRRVRTLIGLPHDDIDRLLPPEDEIRSTFDQGFTPRSEALGMIQTERAVTTRLLFWPRSEYGPARDRWPELIPGADAAGYFGKVQADLQEFADAGASRVVAVPAEVDGFSKHLGTDVVDSAKRRRYLEIRVQEGHWIAWPPGRNEPCWCGSKAKYKKCCGAAT